MSHILIIAIQITTLLLAIIIHEVAHGLVALKFGDPTAKNDNRLSLNPIQHIDIVGSILLPGLLIIANAPFLFGWAKPVPINPQNFKNPIKDMMWVALAGPLANIIILAVGTLFLHISLTSPISTMTPWQYFLITSIQINLILALFNLHPIPPLDGSRILLRFLPQKYQNILIKCEPYGLPIIFLCAYLGVFEITLNYTIPPLLNGLLPQIAIR